MKSKFSFFAAALLLGIRLAAAPLMKTTAIHIQPDAASPTIGFLKAGTEPTPSAQATAPDGWMAVDLPGPHEAYVSDNDFSKDLNIHLGASMRLEPEAKAPVLATMEGGDKIEITGLRRGWTQIKLDKTITGYIQVGASAAPLSASASPAVPPASQPPPNLSGAAPVSAGPAPAALPQSFDGMLTQTHRVLLIGPRPAYSYQLTDTNGKRIAFLDTSKVEATEKMEAYVDRPVTIVGALQQTQNGKNLVIVVQSVEAK